MQAKLQRLGIWLLTGLSALVCCVAVWIQAPGMVLAGLTPNWPLIWLVCWSLHRRPWQAAVAGISLGMVMDGLTQPQPTHVLGLTVVAILTARLKEQRVIQDSVISVALIVFGMVVIAESLMALQWSVLLAWSELGTPWAERSLEMIWQNHRVIGLGSAAITSLWAPAVYLPLNSLWRSRSEA